MTMILSKKIVIIWVNDAFSGLYYLEKFIIHARNDCFYGTLTAGMFSLRGG